MLFVQNRPYLVLGRGPLLSESYRFWSDEGSVFTIFSMSLARGCSGTEKRAGSSTRRVPGRMNRVAKQPIPLPLIEVL